MRIFLNKNPDGTLFDDKIILPHELKDQIAEMIHETLVSELENFGMPARDKPEMQQIFGQLQRDNRFKQKLSEWFWRGIVSLLILDWMKEIIHEYSIRNH
jgi:hypothetical protein